MSQKRRTAWLNSWLNRWVVNNRFIGFLVILLLILVIIFVFTKIAYIFEPLFIAISIMLPTILVALLFYYLLVPMVDRLEARGIKRQWAILGLFAIILLLIIIGIVSVIPTIQSQLQNLIANLPYYWQEIQAGLSGFIQSDQFISWRESIDWSNIMASIDSAAKNLAQATVGGLGSIIGGVVTVGVVIFTSPIILYYMLMDGRGFRDFLTSVLPTKWRPTFKKISSQISDQLARYIRGQIGVAIVVGLIFFLGYSIIGLDYALIFAILAGVMNLIPYLGSVISTVPALIVAILDSPWMLIKVLLVLAIEQLIESRLVSPMILGSNLNIHPLTILFILLVAGRIFGVPGVLLGVPFYACLKIIVIHLFRWFKESSGLYGDSEKIKLVDQVDTDQ